MPLAQRPQWRSQVIHARLAEVEPQLAAMARGFATVMPASVVAVLGAASLEARTCGSSDVNVEELEAHTNYRGGYTASHPTIVSAHTEQLCRVSGLT